MKSINGMLLVAVAMFVLWIGVTGRFPKLMEAIGILRDRPANSPAPNTEPNDGLSSGSGSGSGFKWMQKNAPGSTQSPSGISAPGIVGLETLLNKFDPWYIDPNKAK